MYKDITTHSQGDKERKPSILENETNGIRFTVHKHIYYGDEWLLTCRDLGVEYLHLDTEDMEEAKEKGIVEMIKLLGNKINQYEKAIVEINNQTNRDFENEISLRNMINEIIRSVKNEQRSEAINIEVLKQGIEFVNRKGFLRVEEPSEQEKERI